MKNFFTIWKKFHAGSQGCTSLAVSAFLALGGLSLIVYGLLSQQEPPVPSVQARGGEVSEVAVDEPGERVLPASPPQRIEIPKITVVSSIIPIGKNPDGTIAVPGGADYDKAAWYKYSSTPGQRGPSVIEGHVDSYESGPSIFFHLGSLKPKDTVYVTREDGMKVEYVVYKVDQHQKQDFPAMAVYGSTDRPELRLITCGGGLDADDGTYDSNIVVYAVMK